MLDKEKLCILVQCGYKALMDPDLSLLRIINDFMEDTENIQIILTACCYPDEFEEISKQAFK